MKKLIEALKAIDKDISESTLTSIENIFESAVDKRAEELATDKINEMVVVVDDYIETISKSIKNELAVETLKSVAHSLDEKFKELDESYKESFDESIDKLVSDVGTYVKYASETYIRENKVALQESATVERANKVIDITGKAFNSLGASLALLDEDKENKDSVFDDAIHLAVELEDEVNRLKNTIAMKEALAPLDALVASKAENLLTTELGISEHKFADKIDNVISIVKDGIKPSKNVDESRESSGQRNKTTRKPSWIK